MGFSARGCVLEGFGVVRRHPAAFLVWSILFLLFALAAAWAVFQVSRPAILALIRSRGADAASPQVMLGLAPGLLVLQPMLCAFTSIFDAAVFRAVLRPQQKGFAHLALGPDELRLFAIAVVVALAGYAAQTLVSMLGRAAMAAGAAGPALNLLLSLAYWGLYLWVAVRISLWAPQAFVERRIDFLRAWRLTAGRFWSLLAMYLLLAAVCLGCLVVVVLAAVMVGGGGAAVVAMTGPGGGGPGDLNLALAAVLGALDALYLLAVAFLSTLVTAAFAAAYRGIAPPTYQVTAEAA